MPRGLVIATVVVRGLRVPALDERTVRCHARSAYYTAKCRHPVIPGPRLSDFTHGVVALAQKGCADGDTLFGAARALAFHHQNLFRTEVENDP